MESLSFFSVLLFYFILFSNRVGLRHIIYPVNELLAVINGIFLTGYFAISLNRVHLCETFCLSIRNLVDLEVAVLC